jgi:hypothetical protein
MITARSAGGFLESGIHIFESWCNEKKSNRRAKRQMTPDYPPIGQNVKRSVTEAKALNEKLVDKPVVGI